MRQNMLVRVRVSVRLELGFEIGPQYHLSFVPLTTYRMVLRALCGTIRFCLRSRSGRVDFFKQRCLK